MTWTCVLAVMLVATLVATHSHSPWSSFVSDFNCKLPRGRTLCLLLLGFPTCSPPRQEKMKRQQMEERHTGERYIGKCNTNVTLKKKRGPLSPYNNISCVSQIFFKHRKKKLIWHTVACAGQIWAFSQWKTLNLTHEVFINECPYTSSQLHTRKQSLRCEGVLPSSMWCWEKGLPPPHRGWPVLSQPPACTPLQEPLRI